MKLLILNGASCSGKSTIIKNIMREKENLFHLSYDTLKWSFSKYQSEKYYKDVQKIVLSVAKTVCEMKYNILSDSSLYDESRQKLINIAKEKEYKIIEVNLESDYKVLEKRFEERVSSALTIPEDKRRIANISKDRFKELHDIFQKEKNPKAIIFRTDIQSIEEISGEITKLL